jgi:phytoene dehydrogenase-like protein
MAKKSSTGALTPDQHAAQDALYEKMKTQGHEYDYVIIGTGNSALTAGALLANAGKKICMLEMHDIAGGYAQNFTMGDYTFCAQIHYTWGCGEGGKMHEFVKKIGLEDEITWELYDDGYDRMVLPDGKAVFIPYGYGALAENIDAAYPGQKEHVLKFGKILTQIRKEISAYPQKKLTLWDYATKWPHFLTLLNYQHKTLQDLFDECNLSQEAQAVLVANAGDMMEPPNEMSIFAYAGLFGGYNTGAYYPTQHFKGYVDALTNFITSHEGCHIYYETEVTKALVENGKITGLETKDGKVFTGKDYICNMDPQLAAEKIIGWNYFPEKYQKKLKYEYSPSGMVIYLGLKDIDLTECGFGKYNTWHLEQWDMNKMWSDQLKGDFQRPWIFLSTPSLNTDHPGSTPEGGSILEIATLTNFSSFDEAQKRSYAEYFKMKQALAERILDWVEEKYIPNLRKHIAVKVVGTRNTNVDYVNAPEGNAYGSRLIPKYMGAGRLKAWTPFENLYWCNASSGYAGIYGTCHTGVQLYMDLTGDYFMNDIKIPTDEEAIARVQQRLEKEGRTQKPVTT